MKIKWTGEKPIVIRDVEFEPKKAVSVSDEALAAKVLGIPGFEEVKRGRKVKADDKDVS